VWIAQMLLASLLIIELTDKDTLMSTLGTYPKSKWIVIARFICAVVLHMALQDEIKQGLDIMKYTLNH
jgi:hypothetical protein